MECKMKKQVLLLATTFIFAQVYGFSQHDPFSRSFGLRHLANVGSTRTTSYSGTYSGTSSAKEMNFLENLNNLAKLLYQKKASASTVTENASIRDLINKIKSGFIDSSFGKVYDNLSLISADTTLNSKAIKDLITSARQEMYNYMVKNMSALIREPEFINIMGDLVGGDAFKDYGSISPERFVETYFNLPHSSLRSKYFFSPDSLPMITNQDIIKNINDYINNNMKRFEKLATDRIDISLQYLNLIAKYNSRIPKADAINVDKLINITLAQLQNLSTALEKDMSIMYGHGERLISALRDLSQLNKTLKSPSIAKNLVDMCIKDYPRFIEYKKYAQDSQLVDIANDIIKAAIAKSDTLALKVQAQLVRKMNKLKDDAITKEKSEDRAAALTDLNNMISTLEEADSMPLVNLKNAYIESTLKPMILSTAQNLGLKVSGIKSILQKIQEFFGFKKERAAARTTIELGKLTAEAKNLETEGSQTKGTTETKSTESTQGSYDKYGKEGDDNNKDDINDTDFAE